MLSTAHPYIIDKKLLGDFIYWVASSISLYTIHFRAEIDKLSFDFWFVLSIQ